MAVIYLIDIRTNTIIDTVEVDSFEEFIRSCSNYFPYKDPETGLLKANHPLGWAINYEAYWSKYPPKGIGIFAGRKKENII